MKLWWIALSLPSTVKVVLPTCLVVLSLTGSSCTAKRYDDCMAGQHVEVSPLVGNIHRVRFWVDDPTEGTTVIQDRALLSVHFFGMKHFNRHLRTGSTDTIECQFTSDTDRSQIPDGTEKNRKDVFRQEGPSPVGMTWELHNRHIRLLQPNGMRATIRLESQVNITPGWNVLKIDMGRLSSWFILEDGVFRSVLSLDELRLKNVGHYDLSRCVSKVKITASNITVDCFKGFTDFAVGYNWEDIPLVYSVLPSLSIKCSLYSSSGHFHPVLRLVRGGHAEAVSKAALLGWNESMQAVTAKEPQLIPPFRVLDLILECREKERDTVCSLQVTAKNMTNSILSTTTMSQSSGVPQTLVLRSRASVDAQPYTVRLQGRETGGNGVSPLPCPPSHGGSSLSAALATLLIVGVLLLVLVLVLKLLFGATLTYRPTLKCLSWVVHGNLAHSSSGDGELVTWKRGEEQLLLLQDTPQTEAVTAGETEARQLHQAVCQHSVVAVRRLLQRGVDSGIRLTGLDTTALQEAHLRCHEGVLREMGARDAPAEDEIVRGLVPILQQRMQRLFAAAEQCGYSSSPDGVEAILREGGVSPHARDPKGRTLLHLAVTAVPATGAPRWSEEDVAAFLCTHRVYCNAVDYEGNTPLHTLVTHAFSCNEAASEAWVSRAVVLLQWGADPATINAEGLIPLDIAQLGSNDRLVELLAKQQPSPSRRSHLFKTAADAELEKSKCLLDAAITGFDRTLTELLRRGRIDPVLAGGCPLAASVMHSHYDVMCVLLSAGASPCSGRGLTALQVAQYKNGLPAAFAALLRIECYNRLNYEAAKAPDSLLETICSMRDEVISDGAYSSVTDSTNEADIREPISGNNRKNMDTLAKLAQFGLEFSCQIFYKQKNIRNNMPNEVNPITEALNAGKENVALVMSKDTYLTPFPDCTYQQVPSTVADSLLMNDIKVLEDFLIAHADSDQALFNFCTEIKTRGIPFKSPELPILVTITKLGLQTIFHRVIEAHRIDVGFMTDLNHGVSLLHIAAAYGQVSMIKSLLHLGLNPDATTAYGETPYHLSAVQHHAEAVTCFLEWATHLDVSLNTKFIQLDLSQIIISSNNRVNSLPILNKSHSLQVLCESNVSQKRATYLKKRWHNIDKLNLPRLLLVHTSTKSDYDLLLPQVRKEMQHLLLKLTADCPALKCSLISTDACHNKFSFYVEYDFKIAIDRNIFQRHKFVDAGNVEIILKESFQAAVTNAVTMVRSSHCFLNSETNVTYPYIKTRENSVVIYTVKHVSDKLYRIKNTLRIANQNSEATISERFTPEMRNTLDMCLVLCSSATDYDTRVLCQQTSLSPTLPKLNVQLAEDILTETIKRIHLNIRTRSSDQHHPRMTESCTDLLNHNTCVEGSDDSEMRILNSSADEVTPMLVTPTLYKQLVEAIALALQECRKNQMIHGGTIPDSYRKDLHIVEQTFAVVETFLQSL